MEAQSLAQRTKCDVLVIKRYSDPRNVQKVCPERVERSTTQLHNCSEQEQLRPVGNSRAREEVQGDLREVFGCGKRGRSWTRNV